MAKYNLDDVNNTKAKQLEADLRNGLYGSFICSDYIFDEVVTLLAVKTKKTDLALEVGEYLLGSEIEMIEVKTEVFNAAWELFKKRKNLSFTDCTTIELIKAHGIKHLASFDQGFKQFSKEIRLLG